MLADPEIVGKVLDDFTSLTTGFLKDIYKYPYIPDLSILVKMRMREIENEYKNKITQDVKFKIDPTIRIFNNCEHGDSKTIMGNIVIFGDADWSENMIEAGKTNANIYKDTGITNTAIFSASYQLTITDNEDKELPKGNYNCVLVAGINSNGESQIINNLIYIYDNVVTFTPLKLAEASESQIFLIKTFLFSYMYRLIEKILDDDACTLYFGIDIHQVKKIVKQMESQIEKTIR